MSYPDSPTEIWWRSLCRTGQRRHAPIPPPPHPTYDIAKVIEDALAEDAGDLGDVTTLATISPSTPASATFMAKATGILAGLAVADEVFQLVDPQLRATWSAADGDRVVRGQVFGVVHGSARSILVAERIALNFMQRMSGIATATAAMVEAAAGRAKILETRKTAPGLRLLDKWAVLIGGGCNHRIGLYDMVMIKDNHIAAAGGIKAAVSKAEAYIQEHKLRDMCIEVEVRSMEEVEEICEVLDSGSAPHVKRVMLDNMTVLDVLKPSGVDCALLRQAVARIDGRVDTEASGNVVLSTVGEIAGSGVTYVSCGSLTHSVTALDISLIITSG